MGLGEAFIYNVPERITVSNIGITSTPEVLEIAKSFRQRLLQLHTSPMKKFQQWNIHSYNDITDANIRVENKSDIYTFLKPYQDIDIAIGTGLLSIQTERILPMNKDWAVRFGVKMGHDGSLHYGNVGSVTNRRIGLFSRDSEFAIPDLGVFDSGGDYSNNQLTLQSSGMVKKFNPRSNVNTNTVIHTSDANAIISVSIIKSGDTILLQTQYGDSGHSAVYSAISVGGGDFGFCVTASKPTKQNEGLGLVTCRTLCGWWGYLLGTMI